MNEIQKTNGATMEVAETVGHDTSITKHGDTLTSVLAAQAKAEVEARYIVAMNRPRNVEQVRVKLRKECERPGFADAAYYKIPNRGEGLSIRFAEAALRAMGNVDPRVTVVYDDTEKRVLKVDVIDLESNVCITDMIVLMKTIERKFLKKGEQALSSRINSYGEVVYLRQATDDEMRPVQNSMVSKSFRNGILRLLPGDIQDECKARIRKIREGAIPSDPAAQLRLIIDSFESLGISIPNLQEYIGHDISSCNPKEKDDLRELYSAVKSGETTFWDELKVLKDSRSTAPAEDEGSTMEKLTKKHKGEKIHGNE